MQEVKVDMFQPIYTEKIKKIKLEQDKRNGRAKLTQY